MPRSNNFSTTEIELIINLIEEFPELVSNEFSSRLPNRREHLKRWELLAKKLSAVNMGIPRTGNQVRNKWNDLKYRVKQKVVKRRKYSTGTSGEPATSNILLPYEERIINIIGNGCTEGITSESCDTLANENTEEIMIESVNVKSEVDEDSYPLAPPDSNIQENVPQAPQSWPLHELKNNSTLRGEKRKRVYEAVVDFKLKAFETQKDMYHEIKDLSKSIKSIIPAVCSQQQDTAVLKDTLLSINKNIEIMNMNINKLVSKIDETNKLLAYVLHADD